LTEKLETPTGYTEEQWALVLEMLAAFDVPESRKEALVREVWIVADWYGGSTVETKFKPKPDRRHDLKKMAPRRFKWNLNS
jgi:hypothetical protein